MEGLAVGTGVGNTLGFEGAAVGLNVGAASYVMITSPFPCVAKVVNVVADPDEKLDPPPAPPIPEPARK